MLYFIVDLLVAIAGFADGFRYRILSNKIRKYKSTKGHSRRFMMSGIFVKSLILFKGLMYRDWALIVLAITGLLCLIEYYILSYIYYPYKYRGLAHFKRPSFLRFFINSILPDSYKKRL